MGYQLDESIQPRLLLFFRQNDYCDNYHARYLNKLKKYIFYFNMDVPTEKDLKAAEIYKVVSVPTLILLNKSGYEELRWVGGIGPDANLLNIEMGMAEAWWENPDAPR